MTSPPPPDPTPAALRIGRHSADVRMQLNVNGRVLDIAQLGPDFLVLETPVDEPPGEGEIVFRIDDHEERWTVHLPEGIAVERRKTRIGPRP